MNFGRLGKTLLDPPGLLYWPLPLVKAELDMVSTFDTANLNYLEPSDFGSNSAQSTAAKMGDTVDDTVFRGSVDLGYHGAHGLGSQDYQVLTNSSSASLMNGTRLISS